MTHSIFCQVIAMDGVLSENKPFGKLNRRCNQVSGTQCSFECVCPGKNCKYIAVHVTAELMKSRAAKLCEIFMMKPDGVSKQLAIAVDRIAATGGSDLDKLLKDGMENKTIPTNVGKQLEADLAKQIAAEEKAAKTAAAKNAAKAGSGRAKNAVTIADVTPTLPDNIPTGVVPDDVTAPNGGNAATVANNVLNATLQSPRK